MRNDKKTEKTANISRVQGYHEGGYTGNYAYMGFRTNKYFTSDRFITLDANFNRPDGKPLQGYGLEIETVCNGLTNNTVYAELLEKVILSHFPDDLFKLQHDGSLGGDTSAECITQVMTREALRNNYANFKLMYNTYFPAFNIACDSTCGMHTNISLACFGKTPEGQAEAVRKLYYIINKHFNLCCYLFNRNPNRTHYCSRMHGDSITPATVKAINLEYQSSSHGVCFNLGHYREGRIELRLVGGQRDFGCFRNTMECIFHLVDAVKRISWTDCDDITKIFSGCNQYVFDRLKTKVFNNECISQEQLNAIRPTVVSVQYL